MRSIFTFFLLVLSVFLVGCNKDTVTPNIVGDWQIQRFTQTEKDGNQLQRCPDYWDAGTFTIRNDKTATLLMMNTTYQYTYNQQGNTITFNEQGTGLILPYTIRYSCSNELIIDHFHKNGSYEVSRTFILTK
jgi:hypothetical protein